MRYPKISFSIAVMLVVLFLLPACDMLRVAKNAPKEVIEMCNAEAKKESFLVSSSRAGITSGEYVNYSGLVWCDDASHCKCVIMR